LNEQAHQEIATELKLNLEEFDRDRNSFAATEEIVQDMQLANILKIEGTPSFLVISSAESEVISGVNFKFLKELI
jgi:predicted DsbA family dithiol-disulfide isomerase